MDVFRYSFADGNGAAYERDTIIGFEYMSGTTSNDFIDLRGLGKGTSKVKYDIVKDAKTNFATVAVYIDNNSSTDLNILLQNVVYNTDLRNQIKNFVLV